MAPLVGMLTVTWVAVVRSVRERHLTPAAPAAKLLETTVPEAPVLHVIVGPPVATVGAAPTPPETRKVAHSLAIPMASPTAEPAAAAFLACRKFGRVTAERMPTIATTIISSIRVKPFCRGFLFSRRLRIKASLVLGEIFMGGAERGFWLWSFYGVKGPLSTLHCLRGNEGVYGSLMARNPCGDCLVE